MRSRRAWSILAIALTTSPIGADFAAAGTLIERTVAFVNKKPVLLSDVQLTQALLKIEEKEAIERSIDESLMFQEASRLVSESPPEEAVSRAVLALDERAGPGFTRTALRRKALVQLAISTHIELRLRPQVRVEDEEVRKVFNVRLANDPQSPPFELLADAIRETLESRSLDQKIEEWVASLRLREEVRRVAPRP